jgi:hypothetical protein
MATLPANCSLSSSSLSVNRLTRSISSLLVVLSHIGVMLSTTAFNLEKCTLAQAHPEWLVRGSVAPNLYGTSPIIAPLTAPRSFQRSARFAYRMISELVIVNIFGSRGTARSSRSAQFTEHRWSHAAQPKSGTTALRPRQACRYIDRVA